MIKQQTQKNKFREKALRVGILLGLTLGFANIGFFTASGLLYKYGKPLGSNICILLITLLFVVFTINMIAILTACIYMGSFKKAKEYNKTDLYKGIFVMGALVTALPAAVDILSANSLFGGIIGKEYGCINSQDMFIEMVLIPAVSGAVAIFISREEPILFKNDQ